MYLRITDKFESTKFRLTVVEMLRLLKRQHSYRELSKITGLPETVLCRYVKGNVIPSIDQAENIWRSIQKHVDIRRVIRERVEIAENGFIDMSEVLGDPQVLRLVAYHVFAEFAGRRVTKVLTPETNGIPLATSIALTLEVPMVVARKTKENPYEDYLEESVVESPASVVTYYVPRRAIKKRDSVLIVDDFAQTGNTIRALANIVGKAKALLGGVVVLVATGDSWIKDLGAPSSILVNLDIRAGPAR